MTTLKSHSLDILLLVTVYAESIVLPYWSMEDNWRCVDAGKNEEKEDDHPLT